jgi:hypothetical protein
VEGDGLGWDRAVRSRGRTVPQRREVQEARHIRARVGLGREARRANPIEGGAEGEALQRILPDFGLVGGARVGSWSSGTGVEDTRQIDTVLHDLRRRGGGEE